jgi:diacylglycerol kinase (ATP)
MHERRFVESFNAAIEGFIYVLKTERNMRFHYIAALVILLLGLCFNFSLLEMFLLSATITLVLVAEMLNTTVELLVDWIGAELHPAARIIKDVGAGAVLVAALNALIVGYLLFSRKVPFEIGVVITKLRQSPWHITLISIILVLGLSVLGKVIFHKGTPLRGGMPSGHAAAAFSMWTVIVFLTTNSIITFLTFVMAFLIARHRLKDGVHTIPEVVVGGVLGVLVTTLVFQLLR